jgi:CNT family concentrative nucleoside transporter
MTPPQPAPRRRSWTAAVAVSIALLLPLAAHAATATTTTTAPVITAVARVAPPLQHATLPQRVHSLLGLFVLIGIAWGIGRLRGAKGKVRLRTLGWGIVLQFVFGGIVVLAPGVLAKIEFAVEQLLAFTLAGARIVFGDLATVQGPAVTDPAGHPLGFVQNAGYFACFVLPTIVFFACLTAIAYHSGVMQYVVQGLAWVMAKTMGCSGAETLCTAANIFVGQAEAPLMVKPFVAVATQSELLAMMVIGFANIASGVLGLYTAWLSPYVENAAGHLAAACFIAAPGSLMISKLFAPETETAVTAAGVQFKITRTDANLVDAAARGTTEGLALALNVAAMLISFTALIAFADAVLGWAGMKLHIGTSDHPLEVMLGYVFRPLAWLVGVSWAGSGRVGSLLGVKTVLNELIAYGQMKDAFAGDPNYLSVRDRLLATYALCGFANFASVGIQVGGISTIAPTRRADLSRLGLLAMVGGALASLMAACVVGVLV